MSVAAAAVPSNQWGRSGRTCIVESFEPTEDWFWCYVDEVPFQLDDVGTLSYASGPTEEVRRVI